MGIMLTCNDVSDIAFKWVITGKMIFDCFDKILIFMHYYYFHNYYSELGLGPLFKHHFLFKKMFFFNFFFYSKFCKNSSRSLFLFRM